MERLAMSGEGRKLLLICTTARSGSNLLADYLNTTGLVGHIAEYFNPHVIKVGSYGKKFDFTGEVSVEQYIEFLANTHPGPHGIWGAKLLFEDVDHLVKFPAVRNILEQGKLVFLRRRSKLAQAISYYLAISTGKWVSTDRGHREYADVSFDYKRINQILEMLACQEALWSTLFMALGQRPREIIYESFLEDPGGHMRGIMEYVGIDPTNVKIGASMSKQSSDLTREYADAFLKTRWNADATPVGIQYAGVSFRS
jgi:trehalose 2-sulfotransferase